MILLCLIILFVIIIAFVIIILVILNNQDDDKLEFGVIPGASGTPIVQCGANKNKICEIEAKTINEAVEYCNLRVDICDMFSYDTNTLKMQIIGSINDESTRKNTSSSNVFVRQK